MKNFTLKILLLLLFFYLTKAETKQIQEQIPCTFFPPDNIWNSPIDELPMDANSNAYIQTIGTTKGLHPDFGSGEWNSAPIGIPYVLVPGNQPKVTLSFQWPDECDPGPYPIPPNPPIEGGVNSTGDRHILIVDTGNCILYEIYSAYPNGDGTWRAGSGAVFDLNSNNLRPDTWTSADAAGLPILPGLVRFDEVATGEINHAIRFTCPQTRRDYVWPARHYASSLTDMKYPPMGQRFRLKSSVDISGYPADVRVILRAMKKYGIILADNGSAWFISGVPDERWNNDSLNEIKKINGSDFEAVDCSSLMIDANSGQAKQSTGYVESSENSNTIQCYPNPFNSELTINIKNLRGTIKKIEIVNFLGETVRTFNNMANGNSTVLWDGRDDNNVLLNPGTYFINISDCSNDIHLKVLFCY
ncbi:MAG: T9SS type A sorting domain-containing protein [Bacteroidetes bacterium]|nr:MAG: T9SS type A sorting domain-containing protein [Bacteroidota bacterium]